MKKHLIIMGCMALMLCTSGCIVAPEPVYAAPRPHAYYAGYGAYPVYYGGYHHGYGYYNHRGYY